MSAWLGHSEAVSLKHYLSVSDELFDKVSQPLEKSAAECSRIERNQAEPDTSEAFLADDDNACFIGLNVENRTAPPGTRTPDPLIKNQLLCHLS